MKKAKEQEKKYEWLQVADYYSKAYDIVLKEKDITKAAELQEEIGYCFYRAALQSKTNSQFKKRMKTSIQTYKKAAELYQKSENEKAAIKTDNSLAKIAYCKSWLELDYSKKKKFVQEWWTLKFKILEAYNSLSDQLGIAKTINDILENSSVNINELKSIIGDRRRVTEKLLSLGEEAIKILSKIGDTYELARAYCWTSWHYSKALVTDTHKINELPEQLKDFSKKALKLSKKTKNAWLIGWANNASNIVASKIERDRTAQSAFLRNQIKQAKLTKDNYLLVTGQSNLILINFVTDIFVEDPDKNREFHQNNVKMAKESIQNSLIFNIRNWEINGFAGLAVSGLASIEMDTNLKRTLLLEAIKYNRKGAEYSKGGDKFDSIWATNILNNALYQISEIEPNTIRKKSYLEEVLDNANLNLKLLEEEEYPTTKYFFKAHYQNSMALAAYSLSKMESDREKKIDLLNVAISAIEKCVKTTKMHLKKPLGKFVYGPFGRFYYKFGEIYYYSYSHTKEKNLLSKIVDIYHDTIELYKKIERYTGIAESYWQKALINNQLGEQLRAAKDYTSASEAYKKAAKKIPQLLEFYMEYSLYMQAWSQIEHARHSHSIEDYEESQKHYKKAAELHESTSSWNYLVPNYFAWSYVEGAENLSRKENPQLAKEAFQKAYSQFNNAEESFNKKIEEITSSDEKEMVQKLLKSSNLRSKYCQARILMENAKLLQREGKNLESSKNYQEAAQKIISILDQKDVEDERKELEYVAILCRAWQKMAMAEEANSSELYLKAAKLFEKAQEKCYTKKGSLWALGNSSFCKGLAAGIGYQNSLDLKDHAKAKGYIKNASTQYLQAGFKQVSEYAKASQRLFDAYLFMNQAESEPNTEKRVKDYQLAENLLELSAESFLKAKQLEKTAQVQQILRNVREEKELAISFNEVLQAPSIISSTSSFVSPTSSTEVSVGLETFEHANIQANLVTHVNEVKVGESFCISIEFVNAGKEPALLTRVEEFIPNDFVVVKKPEIYRIEDTMLNMKGKQIQPLKLVEAKLVLQSSKKGVYQLKPTVHYLDELGQNKTLMLKAIEIKVDEVILTNRLSTGTKELDSLLLGGIPEEYAVALTGSPSDEREMIINGFLGDGTKEELITFYITTKANGLEKLLEKSNFYLFLCNPKPKVRVPDLPNIYKLRGKTDLTNLSIALAKAYRKVDSTTGQKRVCVEIVSDVLLHYKADATRKWISELITDLGSKGFTMLAVMDPSMHPADHANAVLNLFDGEISITQTEDPLECKKSIRVRKLRNQDYIKNPICLTNK